MTTPLKAARAWVTDHPDQGAVLYIQAGRRQYKFVAQAGMALPHRHVYVTPFPAQAESGRCEICGQMVLTPEIALVWGADPEAGQPVAVDAAHTWMTGKTFRADLAHAHACPACRVKYGLRIDNATSGRNGWQDEQHYYEARRHPLARYAESDVTVHLEV